MAQPLRERINWRLVFALPIIAAIIHLIATFLAMNDTRASAYARLSGRMPVNTMTLAEPVTPGHQMLPFTSSDARYSVCPFETTKSPVRVKAFLPDVGWTLGIYKPDGTSAYFAAASPGRGTTISLSIVPEDDRFLGLTPQALGKATAGTEPQTLVTAAKGIVLVRGPDKGAPYRAETEAVLATAKCASASN